MAWPVLQEAPEAPEAPKARLAAADHFHRKHVRQELILTHFFSSFVRLRRLGASLAHASFRGAQIPRTHSDLSKK
jgi:hypothetical protein